jgi:hypothetical protein
VTRGLTLKGLLVAGVVLLAIGLERLLNAYLLGGQSTSLLTRVLVGALCITAGSLLLALTGYIRLRRRP